MNTNRRNFLRGFGGLAAVSALGDCKTSGLGFNCGCRTYQGEKLKFGIIGAGGKGWTDWRNMFWHGELPVAMCWSTASGKSRCQLGGTTSLSSGIRVKNRLEALHRRIGDTLFASNRRSFRAWRESGLNRRRHMKLA